MSTGRLIVSTVLAALSVMTATMPADAQFFDGLRGRGGGFGGYGSSGFGNSTGFGGGNSFGGFGGGGVPGFGGGGVYTGGNVSGALSNLDRTTDQISRTIQVAMQIGNRTPAMQANDAQIIQALNAFKDQIRTCKRAADGGDQKKLLLQLNILQTIANNISVASQRAGYDFNTLNQVNSLQSSVQQIANLASVAPAVVPNNNNNYWSPGGNAGGFITSGLSLLNTQRLGADQVSVTWAGGGRNYTYTSRLGSYMLSDGATVRPATGDEVNLLNVAYSQAGMGAGSFNQPSYTPGVMQVNTSGKGQFVMMGQVFMNIRNLSIQTVDPISRRVNFSISAGRDVINFTGTLQTQTFTGTTINITGSDRGAASGSINSVINGNGDLLSANGNGNLNGQGFVLSFNTR